MSRTRSIRSKTSCVLCRLILFNAHRRISPSSTQLLLASLRSSHLSLSSRLGLNKKERKKKTHRTTGPPNPRHQFLLDLLHRPLLLVLVLLLSSSFSEILLNIIRTTGTHAAVGAIAVLLFVLLISLTSYPILSSLREGIHISFHFPRIRWKGGRENTAVLTSARPWLP